MRPLLATAGLLVLAGVATAAAAAKPTAHTLRKSGSGPIAGVAQDNSVAAWLTVGGTKGCNLVHVLSPGKRDRSLPQPSSGTSTCNWDLSEGVPQLAVAARMSTALWTLPESGPAPVDFVLAAPFGGPERQVDRLAHASDGTGKWLGGVAGAGRTLAYSWDDVEYVDPEKCLSTGFCKQKVADGGIRIVTRTGDQPLPNSEPALELAASSGRIAYIPATTVRGNRGPSANTNGSVPIVNAASGDTVAQAFVHGIPIAIALSPHVLAVLTTQTGPRDRISWFSASDGTKLGSVTVSRRAASQLAANDQLVVYRVGRLLRSVSTHNGHNRKLVKTAQNCVGLSLAHGRLIWAENHGDTGRLRALAVG